MAQLTKDVCNERDLDFRLVLVLPSWATYRRQREQDREDVVDPGAGVRKTSEQPTRCR